MTRPAPHDLTPLPRPALATLTAAEHAAIARATWAHLDTPTVVEHRRRALRAATRHTTERTTR